jgi:serine/threonine protein phosphatase PrpC
MEISVFQDQGDREYQEDRYVVLPRFAGQSHLTFCCVADGHGGASVSSYLASHLPALLSDLIIEEQKWKLQQPAHVPGTPKVKRPGFGELMGSAVKRCIEGWDAYTFGDDRLTVLKSEKDRDAWFANIDIKKYEREGKTAGSTVCGMLINFRKHKAWIVNLGDSRCCWLLAAPDGSGPLISQTVDDNVKQRKVPGFKVKIEDGRLAGDLAMSAACGFFSSALSLSRSCHRSHTNV